MIMNYYRCIDRGEVQFDFLVHRQSEGVFDTEIEALGGRIYHLPRLNPFNPIYRIKLHNFFCNHNEYSIIHVHQDCMSGVILKSAKKTGCMVRIAHSHNSNQEHNFKYPIKLLYKRAIPRYATHLFACGEEAGKWMFGNHRFDIVRNGIDVEKYRYNIKDRQRIRNEFNVLDNELLVGNVGRFSEQKNHKFIIDVFEAIQRNNQAKLLLVGNGELLDEIIKLVNQKNLSDKVIFAGLRNDIPSILQAIDVFLMPSLYEGVPVALIEAQAAGIPCIISDTIPEESVLTESCLRLSLNIEPKEWAESLVSFSENGRSDNTESIKKAGYDVRTEALNLQGFYKKIGTK